MSRRQVIVIGAGVAGLASALELSARGLEVLVVERGRSAGGKLRPAVVDGATIDAGPTVFTMRWVFEELFAAAGLRLDRHLTLRRAQTLARHAWPDGARLDLHADIERSAEAIAEFASAAEARRYLAFCERARRVYTTLERPFIAAMRPSPLQLVQRVGVRGLGGLSRIAPFTTLWQSLGNQFRDPRLRQLFGRYATYCGSSPFHAPATLMLVAHVEQAGVWLVQGGMHRIAEALRCAAQAQGARFRFGEEVSSLEVRDRRVTGVNLRGGDYEPAEAVVANTDAAALHDLLPAALRSRLQPTERPNRSLSAITWATLARTEGFPLVRHNVFFSDDYPAEFTALVEQRRLPGKPTVYVCAQDRGDREQPAPTEPERLLCLVNAPAVGDTRQLANPEIDECEARTFEHLVQCGLNILPRATVRTTPADFAELYPATGGALYGAASHGWLASFRRPGSRTAIPGLYLAGGSTHPGPGVPMAVMSARLASACVLQDMASRSPFPQGATAGGTSMR